MNRLVSASIDGTIRLWDTQQAIELHQAMGREKKPCWSSKFIPVQSVRIQQDAFWGHTQCIRRQSGDNRGGAPPMHSVGYLLFPCLPEWMVEQCLLPFFEPSSLMTLAALNTDLRNGVEHLLDSTLSPFRNGVDSTLIVATQGLTVSLFDARLKLKCSVSLHQRFSLHPRIGTYLPTHVFSFFYGLLFYLDVPQSPFILPPA
jgi:hypothetical protein